MLRSVGPDWCNWIGVFSIVMKAKSWPSWYAAIACSEAVSIWLADNIAKAFRQEVGPEDHKMLVINMHEAWVGEDSPF